MTGQLEHPGIVPVHDMGEDDSGRPFYVMKLVRGRSLKQAIKEYHSPSVKPQTPREMQWLRLLQVFVDLCHAVAYAHSRGVLHRDLKPDNIMLGAYGETVVLDWGLAKLRGEAAAVDGPSSVSTTGGGTNTQAGSIMGSPLYMPPEMAESRIPDTDERSDVYLLGATLYEILTGRPPREGKSLEAILELARTTAPVLPRPFSGIRKALNAICLKALSSRKEDRYASAMELADDVQRYMAGEPVSAWRENILIRVWRWAKRHQLALKRTATVAVILAAAVVTESRVRQASVLQAREAARTQIQDFDALADEARFYASNTDSTAEHAPYYDPEKSRIASRQALATAAVWGPTFERLPFGEDRQRLREEMYELLLLMIQDACQSPHSFAAADVSGLLDRAQQMMPKPSRGYYLLRGQYCRLLNDPEGAARQERLANAPDTPSIAFDSFLLGEECRRRSANEAAPPTAPDAVSSRQKEDLAQAIDFYRQAVTRDPRHFWAHFQLGRCYMSAGRMPEAVEALGTCVALRPDAPWGYSARGLALGLLHRFGEAQTDLDRAIQLNSDFRPAWLNRGVVYWLQNNPEQALTNFDAALRPPEDRKLVEGAYYRAQVYLQQNDLVRALSDLNMVIAERKDFYPAYLLRARVELLRGSQSAGLEDLNALLKQGTASGLDLATADGLGRRGRMLRRVAAQLPDDAAQATLRLACHDLETAISLGGRSAEIYTDLGAVRELMGQADRAVEAYSAALQLAPQDVGTRIHRGWLFQKLGLYDDASRDFSQAIAADVTQAEPHAGLGYVLACQQSFVPAQEEAAKALLYGADDYLILHNVACIYAEMSRTDLQRQTEHRKLAIATLGKAVDLWHAGGAGPDELQLIKREPAFGPALRQSLEFQQLIHNVGR
jgi:tetratricopeptide (TPR) repeat protein